ncbi:hypothetical protein EYF80_062263 [Liparis tanakae]|uniref:Uncharacterized protein n=1 Tax=Liparis tanakae TaxID=230148 RepID=A0A4Z2EH17_9TELE|nr:hypothetical protein EYF80_062263 [Liparis tanakae]
MLRTWWEAIPSHSRKLSVGAGGAPGPWSGSGGRDSGAFPQRLASASKAARPSCALGALIWKNLCRVLFIALQLPLRRPGAERDGNRTGLTWASLCVFSRRSRGLQDPPTELHRPPGPSSSVSSAAAHKESSHCQERRDRSRARNQSRAERSGRSSRSSASSSSSRREVCRAAGPPGRCGAGSGPDSLNMSQNFKENRQNKERRGNGLPSR